jgi:hypothetical protein
MKTLTVAMTALLMGAATATAQVAIKSAAEKPYFSNIESHQRVDLRCASGRYLAALGTANEGVIESAMAHVVRMKMYRPNENFPDLRAAINSVAVVGPTAAIRYKAYLASLVLDNPAWFKEECGREYRNPTELFAALANRLEKALISHAGRIYARPE